MCGAEVMSTFVRVYGRDGDMIKEGGGGGCSGHLCIVGPHNLQACVHLVKNSLKM
jgi:hypothetical protein